MSLLKYGIFWTVICDGCGDQHSTSIITAAVLAYGKAVSQGWRGGIDLPQHLQGLPGIFCPACQVPPAERKEPAA